MLKHGSTFVLSVGGSLIAPNGGVDTDFMKAFKKLIVASVRRGDRFVIVTGGGGTARSYIRSAKEIGGLTRDDLDWLGIHATRLNAHLMRTIFRGIAHPNVIKDPTRIEKSKWKQPVLVAAGWKPGWSTDYIATRLAKRLGARLVINLTNTDYVYDKDPHKNTNAKPICEASWKEFRKLVGNTWDPGLNLPFDPVASRFAEASNIQVAIVGPDMHNLADLFAGKPFVGTVIQ